MNTTLARLRPASSFIRRVLNRPRDESERGQVLVIVGAGLLVMILMVGLVIDVGFAWGQQRDSQNASDSAAEAGATMMAANLPYFVNGDPLPNKNAQVAAAVNTSIAANGESIDEAWYTDFDGIRVGGAPLIGPGALSPAADPPADADGVEVVSYKDFDTFIGGVIGINQLTARTKATAVSGFADSLSTGVLPVTFPLTITTCTGSNKVFLDPAALQWSPDQDYLVPLCAADPGNVGWLDWTPTAGGTSELIDKILNPNVGFDIVTPEWYFVSSTGNVSSSGVEDALMTYAPGDQVVIIPIFDTTCDTDPGDGDDLCTTGSGHGSNQWYHLRGWAGFDIEWVDLNGGASVCGSGNGSTGCFKGQFRYFGGLPSGTLAEATGSEDALFSIPSVKLIDSQ